MVKDEIWRTYPKMPSREASDEPKTLKASPKIKCTTHPGLGNNVFLDGKWCKDRKMTIKRDLSN